MTTPRNEPEIRPYRDDDLEPVVALSLRAWAPVFASIEKVLSSELYQEFHPDWREHQEKAVREVCADGSFRVWVADDGELPIGFVAVRCDRGSKLGEIYMIAVDPAAQRCGVGAALSRFALERMREEGMTVAMVETGGDPGHAPARELYRSVGLELFPVARYFKKL